MDMDIGSPPPIRRTRAAFAEIPGRVGRMVITPTTRDARRNVLTPITEDNNTLLDSPVNVPNSLLTPTPSPDELVIQQRGRRHIPVSWSPDIDIRRHSAFRSSVCTPPKQEASASKYGIQTRSTPRKRLLLGDAPVLSPEKLDFSDLSTPQKIKATISMGKSSPSDCKRLKLDFKPQAEYKGPVDLALKGLSQAQLIELFKSVLQKHPELEEEVRKELPIPDLKPLEEKLNTLKLLIFKSLPSSRLTSKTDSHAYSRVSSHVNTFRRCLSEQGKTLVESQHWQSVLQYVFLAWNYARATPIWDNLPHNAPRKQCFKILTSFCMTALKKGSYDVSFLRETHHKLQSLVADSEEINCCIKLIEGQIGPC